MSDESINIPDLYTRLGSIEGKLNLALELERRVRVLEERQTRLMAYASAAGAGLALLATKGIEWIAGVK